jgi:hypothetical protein
LARPFFRAGTGHGTNPAAAAAGHNSERMRKRKTKITDKTFTIFQLQTM